MSSIYVGLSDTPTLRFKKSITIPSDGDPRSAASVNAGMQALADAVASLNAIQASASLGSNFTTTSASFVTAMTLSFGAVLPGFVCGVCAQITISSGSGLIRLVAIDQTTGVTALAETQQTLTTSTVAPYSVTTFTSVNPGNGLGGVALQVQSNGSATITVTSGAKLWARLTSLNDNGP